MFVAFPAYFKGVALAICLLYEVRVRYLQGIFNVARIKCTGFIKMRLSHAGF
jgi:hypothetical protein